MILFEYQCYRLFLRDWIYSQPSNGRGIMKAWSEKLSIQSTLMSQILSGKRNPSLETMEHLADLISLSSDEKDYFLNLVLSDLAATKNLKTYFNNKNKIIKDKVDLVKHQVTIEQEISQEAKNEFYSSWMYSGIKSLCSRKDVNTIEDIRNLTKIPIERIKYIVNFLIKHNICKRDENGNLTVGLMQTYISSESYLARQHRKNWRQRAFECMENDNTDDIFFTGPTIVSKKDKIKIRKKILSFLEDLTIEVKNSKQPNEDVVCLNIDYFTII
jgi:uncharacterized protein (TIGR02147 family)